MEQSNSINYRFEVRHAIAVLLIVLAAFMARPAKAQERRERTLDEIKTEAVYRAENGIYPLIGLDPKDVSEAFTKISSKDKDEWAAGFMSVADRYMAEGKALEKSDPAKADAEALVARLKAQGKGTHFVRSLKEPIQPDHS